MRAYLLVTFVMVVGLYAWRDWFIAVCVLVVMDAVMKHADMPRTLFGIQGANPWNLLLASVVVAWLAEKAAGRTRVDMPRGAALILVAYAVMIVVAFLRALPQVGAIHSGESGETSMTAMSLVSDGLINPLKYIFVAFLLFDGSRTPRNLLLGLVAVYAQAILYAVQVIKFVPPSVLLSANNPYRNRIMRECGLHANDMALVMVVAFWGTLASISLWPYLRWWQRAGGLAGAMASLTALALTMSRAGYLAFAVLGLVFGAVRWRLLLLLAPVVALVVCLAFPSIRNRATEGFDSVDASGQETEDMDAVSAGRTTHLWPPTVDAISESPMMGHGRLAILRPPLWDTIMADYGCVPTHPHNAYLEMLLDSGLIGLMATLAFFIGIPLMCLAQGKVDLPLLRAARGTGLAGAGAILIMGLTGQSFFPREGVFIVLCCFGLMARACLAMPRAVGARPFDQSFTTCTAVSTRL